jgi:hypothetical protein
VFVLHSLIMIFNSDDICQTNLFQIKFYEKMKKQDERRRNTQNSTRNELVLLKMIIFYDLLKKDDGSCDPCRHSS